MAISPPGPFECGLTSARRLYLGRICYGFGDGVRPSSPSLEHAAQACGEALVAKQRGFANEH